MNDYYEQHPAMKKAFNRTATGVEIFRLVFNHIEHGITKRVDIFNLVHDRGHARLDFNRAFTMMLRAKIIEKSGNCRYKIGDGTGVLEFGAGATDEELIERIDKYSSRAELVKRDPNLYRSIMSRKTRDHILMQHPKTKKQKRERKSRIEYRGAVQVVRYIEKRLQLFHERVGVADFIDRVGAEKKATKKEVKNAIKELEYMGVIKIETEQPSHKKWILPPPR